MHKTITETDHDPQCAARHLGLWMVEPCWFAEALAAVRGGTWEAIGAETVRDGAGYRLYEVDGNGIATIPIVGQMIKGDSKYGGTNSVRTRRAVRQAGTDKDVRAILLHIDSPGGTVSGTDDLAQDMYDTGRNSKPVYAYIEDLGASAAYYVASQARRVLMNRSGEVGSIGTVAVVYDSSGMAEAEHVKVHVISTGPYKGAFTDGTEVLPEHLEYLQERVDAAGQDFISAVAKGRKMSAAAVRKAADGRVFGASKAVELGLVDQVVRNVDEVHRIIRRDLRADALSKP